MNVQSLRDSPPDHIDPDRTPATDRAQLLEVATTTLDAIEGADHAAVSLVDSIHPLVATSDTADMLEHAQRLAAEGPTLDAGRSGVIKRINYLSDDVWPTFEQTCSEARIRSVAAFPILDGSTTVGVFTLYSSDHHAFGAPELRTGRLATVELARLLHDR